MVRWMCGIKLKDRFTSRELNIKYEVEGPRPRGRPKRTWTEVVKRTVKHVN